MTLQRDDILYLDDHLVAIQKPSGLSVHRGWDRGDRFALQETRDLVGQYVYPVQRLDRPTSGVLVFALSSATAALLQESLRQPSTEKEYVALVRGVLSEPGTIERPLPAREGGDRVPAMTSYRPLCVVLDFYTLVRATISTGRLHQIRRHFKHISHPLIGDTKYGKGEHNRRFRTEFQLHRLALHARSLSFHHPIHESPLRLFASAPRDLLKPLQACGVSEDILRWLTTPDWQD